ncbi:hypothetical protein BD626DRAFT_563754 [Schizophyllum amplum]|uniref:Chromo domain-containing protein n=1 Tax=Schizophyllum amplum TaxID=97359 RepID=A0A550CZ38_9AGAR|nr:hypothetical protein BD626DRAFT_563754 [Auriculariopsis ampla]
MAARKEWARTLEIPQGPNSDMESLGLVDVGYGDVVFGRSLGASDSSEDMLQCWNMRQSEYDSSVYEKLRDIRDRLLGSREARVANNGRTDLEMDPTNVRTRGRTCFAFGNTLQKPRNVAQPTVGGRPDVVSEEKRALRSDVVFHTTAVGVHALRTREPAMYAAMDAHAEVINLPRIGVAENCAYTSIQVNVHPAVTYKSVSGMKKSMGKSGDSHLDEHDSHGALSTMIATPDIPDDYEGGRFHLLELGFYVRLDQPTVFCFSSLFTHGGTPPIAPPGCDTPALWATRCNIILYSNRYMHEGNTFYSLAAMPGAPDGDDEDGGTTLRIIRTSPAICSPLHESLAPSAVVKDSLFILDGKTIMSEQALADFTARAMTQYLVSVMRQLGHGMSIDANQILGGIKLNSAGNQISLSPWNLGPDGSQFQLYPLQSEGKDAAIAGHPTRHSATLGWLKHCGARAKFIPQIAAQYDVHGNHIATLEKYGFSADDGVEQPRKPAARKAHKAAPRHTADPGSATIKHSTQPAVAQMLGSASFLTRATARSVKAIQSGAGAHPSGQDSDADVDEEASYDLDDNDEDMEDYEVQAIVGHRLPQNSFQYEYCVLWEGTDETAWKPLSDLGSCDDLVTKYNIMHGIIGEMRPLDEGGPDTDIVMEDAASNSTPAAVGSNTGSPLMEPEEMDVDEEEQSTSLKQTNALIPIICELANKPFVVAANIFSQACSAIAAGRGKPGAEADDINSLNSFGRPLEDAFTSLVQGVPLFKINLSAAQLMGVVPAVHSVLALEHHSQISEADNLLRQHYVRSLTYAVFAHGSMDARGDQPWVEQLYDWSLAAVDDPTAFLEDGQTHIKFDPAACDSALQAAAYLLPVGPLEQHIITTEQQKRSKQACDIIQKVISHWFGLHTTPMEQRDTRYIFCCALLEAYGSPSALLLPAIWDIFKRPVGAQLLRPHRSRRPIEQWDVKALTTQTSELPIANKTHAQHDDACKDLHDFEALVEAYKAARLGDYQKRRTRAPPSAVVAPSSLPAGPSTAVPADAEEVLPSALEDAGAHFMRFLRELAPLCKPDISSDTYNNFQKFVNADRDGLLPFRELAPTRARLREAGGWLNLATVQTESGAFSALLNRNVLFNSNMGRQHNGYFAHKDDFWAWRKTNGGKDDQYCNQVAYGATNFRSITNADSCWAQAQTLASEIEHGHPGTPNAYTFRKITEAIHNLPIPACGELIAFLLAGDLVYCGAAPMPSFEEIWRFSKAGALRGLGKLGLPHRLRPEILQSFETLYNLVDTQLTAEEKGQWGWDRLMFEHALCKYSKCLIKFRTQGWCSCLLCKKAGSCTCPKCITKKKKEESKGVTKAKARSTTKGKGKQVAA